MNTRITFIALAVVSLLLTTPVAVHADMIASNFNGTPIPGGDYIWFNSVIKASGLRSGTTDIFIEHAMVTFSSGTRNYQINLPDAIVTYTSTTTTASTTFNTAHSFWDTTIPLSVSGKNAFAGGAAFLVPTGGLPGGINPVTWSADFYCDQPGVKLNWQWSAAVYSRFSTNLDSLGMKSTDDNKADALYKNSDHAGTPEAFKAFVIGGARGGGGSNYTGSYSGTLLVTPQQVPEPATLSLLAAGAMGLMLRRRNIKAGNR